MKFREDMRAAIAPYIEGDSARAALLDLLTFVATAERVLRGETDSDVKQGMAQTVVTFTTGLASNPFWQQHSSYLHPVFATAVTAWMDSFGHLAAGQTTEDRQAFLVTQNILPEIAVAVLVCESGAGGAQTRSLGLRKAVMAVRP